MSTLIIAGAKIRHGILMSTARNPEYDSAPKVCGRSSSASKRGSTKPGQHHRREVSVFAQDRSNFDGARVG